MKKVILSAIAMATLLTACNSNNNTSEKNSVTQTTSAVNGEQAYACPMHPEVKGKKGEACSKCGMELTEPIQGETHITTSVTANATHSTLQQAEASQVAFSIDEIVSNYLDLKKHLQKMIPRRHQTLAKDYMILLIR